MVSSNQLERRREDSYASRWCRCAEEMELVNARARNDRGGAVDGNDVGERLGGVVLTCVAADRCRSRGYGDRSSKNALLSALSP